MTALFSEDASHWYSMPRWVDFLINLGFEWPDAGTRPRRIALISMPCDSVAAGLVALGVHTRDLCQPAANDVDGHYASLISYARQYLDSCRICQRRCDPEAMRCGFSAEATGQLKTIRSEHKRGYMVSGVNERGGLNVVFQSGKNSDVEIFLTPQVATDYYAAGEPPPVFPKAQGGLLTGAYAEIIEAAKIIPGNLYKSFSGTCLAGRASGMARTRDVYSSVHFACNTGDYRLVDLLTVQGWRGPDTVSRMTFFNTRTEEFDRRTSPPALVIADGDATFLKVVGRREFNRSDVIGVYHRLIERDKLDELGAKLLGLRQWYDPDEEMRAKFSAVPTGISVAFLKKRTA